MNPNSTQLAVLCTILVFTHIACIYAGECHTKTADELKAHHELIIGLVAIWIAILGSTAFVNIYDVIITWLMKF